jgi:hypothetical protein
MGSVVANCHKIPADKFRKRLLHPSETVQLLNNMLEYLRQLNHDVHVIFTISPVRHLRDGFVENNRSKAVLIQAVHEVVNNDSVQYFPSYELVLDDLRDYRFFAEDMAHPNYAATQYVWEKFLSVYMNESTLALMKEIQSVTNAYAHKPFNPFSRQHQEFLHTFLRKSELIQQQHPNIDFKNEIEFFKSQLSARTND